MDASIKASLFSAIASAISAICALFTIYMYREQGKGFVWTKGPKITLLTNKAGEVFLGIEVPLSNFGKGSIRFIKLRAKKINLLTKATEKFEMDMDEAYFPEGADIVKYQASIQKNDDKKGKQIVLLSNEIPSSIDHQEYQDLINKNINEIPEHIIILTCTYKDGSWFGLKEKVTKIGFLVTGYEVNYLSTVRRKELDEFFSW